MTKVHEYALGYSAQEARRLEVQAALLADVLWDTLGRAGLREGMRVLDLGAGVGDVSFVAAKLVGPSGTVLGVERWGQSVEAARLRATALGLKNVEFVQADLDAFDTDQEFDAIIGRFILLYLARAPQVLQRLSRRLKSGGKVVFQEIDMSVVSQAPPSPLFAEVYRWIFGAFKAAGAERDMGEKLLPTFLAAGLPRPTMIGVTPVESGPDSPIYEFLVDMVRSMEPVITKAGIASPSELDLGMLAERLRRDAVDNERVIYGQRLVSAWTQVA